MAEYHQSPTLLIETTDCTQSLESNVIPAEIFTQWTIYRSPN